MNQNDNFSYEDYATLHAGLLRDFLGRVTSAETNAARKKAATMSRLWPEFHNRYLAELESDANESK